MVCREVAGNTPISSRIIETKDNMRESYKVGYFMHTVLDIIKYF